MELPPTPGIALALLSRHERRDASDRHPRHRGPAERLDPEPRRPSTSPLLKCEDRTAPFVPVPEPSPSSCRSPALPLRSARVGKDLCYAIIHPQGGRSRTFDPAALKARRSRRIPRRQRCRDEMTETPAAAREKFEHLIRGQKEKEEVLLLFLFR